MKIGILGTGMVGETLGTKFVQLGHQVKMGSRTANNENAGHASGANLRATTRQASMSFHYVYILQNDYSQYYVGITEDLKARLKKHNRGEVPHTSKFRPWSIKTAIAFTSEERARDFEKYLKTASGRAFAKKRL